MAAANPKIVLSRSQDIPFNKLVLSQANVRRVKAGISIEELAEDIAHRGLLHGLSVRPVLDADGVETGMFEVPAGGRRFRALDLLVKQKRMAKTEPVPCVVRTEGLAAEDSLAENVHRVPLHPLDQFRAFQTLREQGLGEEEIAARFFISPTVVTQRLKLASVSPKLLDLYAADEMTLEQLMAFAVTGDHARQEQVWQGLSRSYSKEPYFIRRQLTEGAVRAADKRARFLGIAAYEAAGGTVMRDLFQQDDGGWLQDPALLDRLVAEKLAAEAAMIRAEGWKWVEAAVDFPYGHNFGLRRLAGETALTEEEQATCDALRAEYDALEAQYAGADELPEEVDTRLGEIEAALEAFELTAGESTTRPTSPAPARSSASIPTACCGSSAAMFVPRTKRRPNPRATYRPRRSTRASDPASSASMPATTPAQRASPPCRRGRTARGGRWHQAVAGSARHRADGASHARVARRAGGRPRHRLPRGAARAVPQGVLPLRRRYLPRDRHQEHDLRSAGAGAQRYQSRQGDRGAARALGRAAAA